MGTISGTVAELHLTEKQPAGVSVVDSVLERMEPASGLEPPPAVYEADKYKVSNVLINHTNIPFYGGVRVYLHSFLFACFLRTSASLISIPNTLIIQRVRTYRDTLVWRLLLHGAKHDAAALTPLILPGGLPAAPRLAQERTSATRRGNGVDRLPTPRLITSLCAVYPDALYVPRLVLLAAGPVRASRAVSGLFEEAGMRPGRPLHSRSFAASYSRSVRASAPSFEAPFSRQADSQPLSSSFLFFVSPSVSLLFTLMRM